MSREFKREIDVPPLVDPRSLRCSLTSDGRLVITTQRDSLTPQSNNTNNDLPLLRQQQQHSPISSQEPSELSLTRDECDSLESNSDETYAKNEWTTPLPDVVDNHSIYSEADTTTSSKSPPKCDSSRRINLDASIKSIHCEGRPFNVNINLGRSIEPTQLKIDAIDRILLVRVFMYDSFGHTGVWKVYLPRDLDPSDVAAQLTDEGHLILEEAFQSS